MARPKKHQERLKCSIVAFRLTDAEHTRLAAAAAKSNLRLAELARRLTLAGEKRLVVKSTATCDPAFLKRVEQIGHNLNQLVKNAHIFGRLSPQIPALCDEIKALIDEAVSQEWKG